MVALPGRDRRRPSPCPRPRPAMPESLLVQTTGIPVTSRVRRDRGRPHEARAIPAPPSAARRGSRARPAALGSTVSSASADWLPLVARIIAVPAAVPADDAGERVDRGDLRVARGPGDLGPGQRVALGAERHGVELGLVARAHGADRLAVDRHGGGDRRPDAGPPHGDHQAVPAGSAGRHDLGPARPEREEPAGGPVHLGDGRIGGRPTRPRRPRPPGPRGSAPRRSAG